VRALRVGGRLTCLSELRRRKIWVLDDGRLHVRVDVSSSRLRSPDDAAVHAIDPASVRVHWHPAGASEVVTSAQVSVIDALAEASRCLERRAWIASVDSAMYEGLLHRSEMGQLAAAASARGRRALPYLDSRAESGLESIVRTIAIDLGFRVRSQVHFPGVGWVDLVIEEWIAVETDGSAFHDVALSPRDRRRDATLAALGLTALRPGYALIVHDPRAVADQLIGAVAQHRRVRNAGQLAARARSRVLRGQFS
jgi:very-short-patch-repair endonuclease